MFIIIEILRCSKISFGVFVSLILSENIKATLDNLRRGFGDKMKGFEVRLQHSEFAKSMRFEDSVCAKVEGSWPTAKSIRHTVVTIMIVQTS